MTTTTLSLATTSKPRLTALSAGLLALLLASGAVQAQAPVVTSVVPARNAVAALRTTPVAVSFDQPLSNNAGTLGTLKVFSQQAGGLKAGTTTVSGNTLSFAPTTTFKPGETVQATVTKAVQSSGGQSVAQPQVFQFTTATTPGNGVFGGGFEPNVSGAQGGVALGDVDNDGDLDLFVSSAITRGVSIRLNTGSSPNFVTGPDIPTTINPQPIVLGDLDGDGDLDFVVGDRVGINNGNVTFTISLLGYVVNTGTIGSALGDLDGDGDLDLLSAANSKVRVGLNNGAGTFLLGQELEAGAFTSSVAVGDVDNDGDLDLLVTTTNKSVSVRLNNGLGTFGGGSDVPVGDYTNSVATADVDGDGDLDLVTANGSNIGTVSVRVNDGTGRFSGSQEVLVGGSPRSIAVGDADGDGSLDLFTANNYNGSVSVCLNNGSGRFFSSQQVGVSSQPLVLALGDVDGDGRLDLATAGSNLASVRLNQMLLPAPVLTSLSATSSLVGSALVIAGNNLLNIKNITVNGVAVPYADIVINSPTQLTIVVPVGATSGPVVVTTTAGASNGLPLTIPTTFVAVTAVVPARNAVAAPRATPVAVTFNQPLSNGAATLGALKVFGAQAGGQKAGTTTVSGNTLSFSAGASFKPGETVQATVTSAAQSATGTAATPHVFQFTAATAPGPALFGSGSEVGVSGAGQLIAAGDLDGDGDLDLVTSNASYNAGLSVRFNDGAGRFSGGSEVRAGLTATLLLLGDIDGDGDLDLLSSFGYGGDNNKVYLNRNDGKGTFSSPEQALVAGGVTSLNLGDVDGDGDLDLVTGSYLQGKISVRFNNGAGVFAGGQDLSDGSAESGVLAVLGDVDNDGDLDIVTQNNIRFNSGDGTFVSSRPNASSGGTLGDVDGDGDLDLVGNGLRRNNGQGSFGSVEQAGLTGTLGDVDGDGDLDVVAVSGVRLNDGRGTFGSLRAIAVSSTARGVALGDVDGDGTLDLLAVNSSNSALLSGSVSVRLNTGGVPAAVYRLNAGGPALTTSRGPFAADQYYSANSQTRGATAFIANTPDPTLYLTERASTNGLLSYSLPVANGPYTVVLHFAEFYWQRAGQRIFDVRLEGTKVLSHYDIIAKVGPLVATTETFPVTVTDGVLNVDLSALAAEGGVDQAKLSALEVLVGGPVLATTTSRPAPIMQVYPNPTAGRFTLTYTANQGQAATLHLTDALGRQVHQQTVQLVSGTNQVPVSAPDLAAGLYQLTLRLADGQRLTQKLLVQPW